MKTFLLMLVYITLTIPVSILVMIYGWGLHPANMGIIIGGYLYLLVPSLLIGVFGGK